MMCWARLLAGVVLLGAATPALTAETRTMTDVTGAEVAVPEQPERVVALSERDLDALLALGLDPAGTTSGRGQNDVPGYLRERADDVPIVGHFMQPSLGRLVELQPDLILAGGLPDAQLIGRLRRIAPTVVTYRADDDWRSAFRNAAEALGREQRYRAFLERYRQRVADLRAAIGADADATVSIVRWNPRGPMYMQHDAFASTVIRDLGLARPAAQQEPGVAHSPPLSLEALERIDGDWLFLGTLRREGDARRALERAREMPAFRGLRAVRNGRVVEVDGSLWTSLGGPLAALAVLEDIEQAMVPR
ncbi:ABC transporter substrate-binding protein [Aquisalimonas lutea]|uniref:ABC transporter substrate-binding protein n=1 Tax=Aquisalimonas lutea TaxID=1327750 RepID=UPI0025B2B114|nr:ABC transporter substrate-binding protein [Aquisalimonas lutea]MDN3518858.1 ABC transporter substrate-binding protein [Aquisalimonas lutea]